MRTNNAISRPAASKEILVFVAAGKLSNGENLGIATAWMLSKKVKQLKKEYLFK